MVPKAKLMGDIIITRFKSYINVLRNRNTRILSKYIQVILNSSKPNHPQ